LGKSRHTFDLHKIQRDGEKENLENDAVTNEGQCAYRGFMLLYYGSLRLINQKFNSHFPIKN